MDTSTANEAATAVAVAEESNEPRIGQKDKLEELCVNTIRFLAVDAVEKAKSGHPGSPMGMADMAFVLWTEFLRHDPADPQWRDRDRFVLSAGHASMLLYSLLHLTGYKDMTIDQLKQFRQWGSRTAGHPEYGHAAGIEVTTGPLGQGFANAVGMGLAAKMMAARFNIGDGFKPVNSYIYCICSDGDLEEGISQESASFAGHLGLGNLIYLYDDNLISLAGGTNLTFTEDVAGPVQYSRSYRLETRVLVLDGPRPTVPIALYTVLRSPPCYGGWDEAVAALRRANEPLFPNVSDDRWRIFAHALQRLDARPRGPRAPPPCSPSRIRQAFQG